MGKGGDAPKPQDVVGAAREAGEQERMLAAEQTIANRPNQNSFWGSTNWGATPTYDPVTGQMVNQWTQTESMNPEIQKLLNQQIGSIGQQQSQPFDLSKFGDPIQMGQVQGIEQFTADPNLYRQQAEDAAYQRSASRLDPQFQQQEQALMTRLRNQGLSQGDQAYDAAVANFERGKNDAYEQARLGATGEGRTEASQMYGQQLGAYQANLGAQQQGFGQQMDMNQLSNALRSQGIQEQLMQRGMGTQELSQLMQALGMSGNTPSAG